MNSRLLTDSQPSLFQPFIWLDTWKTQKSMQTYTQSRDWWWWMPLCQLRNHFSGLAQIDEWRCVQGVSFQHFPTVNIKNTEVRQFYTNQNLNEATLTSLLTDKDKRQKLRMNWGTEAIQMWNAESIDLKINFKTILFYSNQSHAYYLLLILTDKNAINLQNVQKQHYCLQSFNSMLLSKTMSCDLLPTFICMQHSVKVVSGCAAHQSA